MLWNFADKKLLSLKLFSYGAFIIVVVVVVFVYKTGHKNKTKSSSHNLHLVKENSFFHTFTPRRRRFIGT